MTTTTKAPDQLISKIRNMAGTISSSENWGRRIGLSAEHDDEDSGFNTIIIQIQNGLAGCREIFKEVVKAIFKIQRGADRGFWVCLGNIHQTEDSKNTLLKIGSYSGVMSEKLVNAMDLLTISSAKVPSVITTLCPKVVSSNMTGKRTFDRNDLLLIICRKGELKFSKELERKLNNDTMKRIVIVEVDFESADWCYRNWSPEYIDNQPNFRDLAVNKQIAYIAQANLETSSKEPYILKNEVNNIFHSIRDNAIEYFKSNNIAWWSEDNNKNNPTGHTLSSQIACLNHLFPFINDKEACTKLLQAIDSSVSESLIFNNQYIDFEYIGNQNYLEERGNQRGQFRTSLDAIMIGKCKDGKRKLFVIEWKYTESYKTGSIRISENGNDRLIKYLPFLNSPDSPIKEMNNDNLFYEPIYQLMRQTLLANEMVKAGEFQADLYKHVLVVPSANKELLSPKLDFLEGYSLEDKWKACLKQPENIIIIDPQKLFENITNDTSYEEIMLYLKKRYWH